MRYKIDVNTYTSKTYVLALYRFKPGLFWGKWEHIESLETIDAARELFESLRGRYDGLPIFLEG